MSENEAPERRQGETSRVWERHFQSILLFATFGVMAWIGNSIFDLNKGFGTVAVHLAQIDERVATLQSQVMSTYRATDAQRDVAETTRQIDSLKQRVTAVESAINGRKSTPELQQWSKK